VKAEAPVRGLLFAGDLFPRPVQPAALASISRGWRTGLRQIRPSHGWRLQRSLIILVTRQNLSRSL
jgi:hypothetical protein